MLFWVEQRLVRPLAYRTCLYHMRWEGISLEQAFKEKGGIFDDTMNVVDLPVLPGATCRPILAILIIGNKLDLLEIRDYNRLSGKSHYAGGFLEWVQVDMIPEDYDRPGFVIPSI